MATPEDSSPAPLFFTDRHDPNLAPYHDLIAEFRANDGKVLNLRVPPETVRTGDISMLQLLVLAAQHHPDVLERLFFGIVFEFEDPDANIPGTLLDELGWKGDPTVQRWFARLQELVPCAVYFAQDHEARFFMLFGDILNRDRDELTFRPTASGRDQMIGIEGEQALTLFNRVIYTSILLLHFCRPTGLVPQVAIEALLAEFDLEENTGWNYERVAAAAEAEYASGIQLQARAVDDDELDDLAPWDGPSPDDDDDEE